MDNNTEESLVGLAVGNMIGDSIEEERNNNSGSGLGIIIFLAVALFVTYIVLLKIGIDPVQIKIFVKWLAMPYIWDYYVNFTYYDLNQYLHTIANALTVAGALFLAWFADKLFVGFMGKRILSKPTKKNFVRAFGSFNYTLGNVLVDLVATPVAIVAMGKFMVHAMLSVIVFILSL
ncbi:hypothetical protein [Psychrobacillus sp. FSL H8-0487]|uniref:hypothetical protein n=1 Tax=Psychrobacillus sp. FSL H8-0487 TaxID=2921391 RepID=UPI0030F66200